MALTITKAVDLPKPPPAKPSDAKPSDFVPVGMAAAVKAPKPKGPA